MNYELWSVSVGRGGFHLPLFNIMYIIFKKWRGISKSAADF